MKKIIFLTFFLSFTSTLIAQIEIIERTYDLVQKELKGDVKTLIEKEFSGELKSGKLIIKDLLHENHYTFNTDGNMIEDVEYLSDGELWHIEIYRYNDLKKITLVSGKGYYEFALNFQQVFNYDENGNKIEKITFINKKFDHKDEYRYDIDGNRTEHTRSEGGEVESMQTCIYDGVDFVYTDYDDTNRIVGEETKKTYFNLKNEKEEHFTYLLFKNGEISYKKTSIKKYNSKDYLIEISALKNDKEETNTYITYNTKGQQLSHKKYDASGKLNLNMISRYNENSVCVFFKNNGEGSRYDNFGNQIEHFFHNYNGNVSYLREYYYIYDYQNNWIKKTSRVIIDNEKFYRLQSPIIITKRQIEYY